MQHIQMNPGQQPNMTGYAIRPVNITGLTLVLSCIMLSLLFAFNTPSRVREGGETPVVSTRCFNGKMCIGPDMMYAVPKAETPVLLAIGLSAPRTMQRAPACNPCTE